MNIHIRAKAIHGDEAQIATKVSRILATYNAVSNMRQERRLNAPAERAVGHTRNLPLAPQSRPPVTTCQFSSKATVSKSPLT